MKAPSKSLVWVSRKGNCHAQPPPRPPAPQEASLLCSSKQPRSPVIPKRAHVGGVGMRMLKEHKQGLPISLLVFRPSKWKVQGVTRASGKGKEERLCRCQCEEALLARARPAAYRPAVLCYHLCNRHGPPLRTRLALLLTHLLSWCPGQSPFFKPAVDSRICCVDFSASFHRKATEPIC